MQHVKTFLFGIGYALTGRWIMASVCFSLLGGWCYIDIHTGKKRGTVDAFTFSCSKKYLDKVAAIK